VKLKIIFKRNNIKAVSEPTIGPDKATFSFDSLDKPGARINAIANSGRGIKIVNEAF
jgi:hypothetical protein